VPGPAAVEGSDDVKRKAFEDTFITLHYRISLFIALPFERLEGTALKAQLDAIAHATTDTCRTS
jgi:hypothetical protein